MSFRKAIFWLHLVAGVLAGIIILIMSLTGVMLAYERQITRLADGVQVPQTGSGRLPLSDLVKTVRTAEPEDIPSSIIVRSDPSAPVAFSFGREKTVFVNPYNGEALGNGGEKTRAFFQWTVTLHRWLGAEGEKRPVGKAITGAANLIFLFIVVSGVYLWFPRKWSAASLKAITLFKSGLRGKARDWNWHNVIGFWCALPLFFVVSTAVVISYPWANNLLFRLTGNEPPPPRAPAAPRGGSTGKGERSTPKEPSWQYLDATFQQASQHVDDWKMITVRIPAGTGPFSFTVDRGNGARPDLRTQLNFTPSGELSGIERYSDYNLGRKLRLWVRWVHTGEAGGIIGQTIAAIASAGAVVLVWTGLMLTWRRFFGRNKRGEEVDSTKSAGAVQSMQ